MASNAAPVPDLRVPLRFRSELKERIWGGQQLACEPNSPPIGEAWLIHEDLEVQGGPADGWTLKNLTSQAPLTLLGTAVRASRFPLLIKLLDCQQWLSVQVHPDDEQARRLVGEDENGKTEAWHVLEAAPGAELVQGVSPDVSHAALRQAILDGDIAPLLERQTVKPSDTYLVPAGTVHALGPGLLIYEVQQTSDTTYRVYDWDRPQRAGRSLHLQESAQVAVPGLAQRVPAGGQQETSLLTECIYFTLELLQLASSTIKSNTLGTRLHIVTVIQGQITLTAGSTTLALEPFDTVVIPAALGAYALSGEAQVLRVFPGTHQRALQASPMTQREE